MHLTYTRLLLSCIVALLLSSCNHQPRYQTSFHYQLPSDPTGQGCITQCQQAQINCQEQCQAKINRCLQQAKPDIERTYAAALEDYEQALNLYRHELYQSHNQGIFDEDMV